MGLEPGSNDCGSRIMLARLFRLALSRRIHLSQIFIVKCWVVSNVIKFTSPRKSRSKQFRHLRSTWERRQKLNVTSLAEVKTSILKPPHAFARRLPVLINNQHPSSSQMVFEFNYHCMIYCPYLLLNFIRYRPLLITWRTSKQGLLLCRKPTMLFYFRNHLISRLVV